MGSRRRKEINHVTHIWSAAESHFQGIFSPISSESTFRQEILLAGRVSTPKQQKHLIDQLTSLRLVVEKHQGVVSGWIGKVTKGSNQEYHKEIAEKAHYLNVETILWESTDRAIRNPDWRWKDDSPPTEEQVEKFKGTFQGLTLLTLLPPEATFEEVRKYQARRGRVEETLKEYQVRKREVLQPLVVALAEKGKSYGEIAEELGLSKREVYKWLKR